MRAALATTLLLATSPAASDAELAALVHAPVLSEISGLAVSRLHPGVLWMHNDSGAPAQLYAVASDGTLRASIAVEGVANTDWEDLAAFMLDGRPYLLVADTGDNGGLRSELALVVIPEPEQLADGSRAPAWTIRFRWPDGPRDCEAAAVDAAAGWVYLVSKKRVPPELWRVPLRPGGTGPVTAEPVGILAGIEQPTEAELAANPAFGRYRAQITGADLDVDARTLAVLNYRGAQLYRRGDHESWAEAVARTPEPLPMPWLPQAEAIGFSPDGATLWISSEKLPAPLLRIRLDRQ